MSELQGERRDPQYIDEVEAMIGPLFTDVEFEKTLHYSGVDRLAPELITERQSIYTGALRIIAEHRWQERVANMPQNVQRWSQEYDNGLTRARIRDIAQGRGERAAGLVEQLAHVNGARTPRTSVEDIASELYEHQKPYMYEVIRFLHHPESRIVVPIRGDALRYNVKGAVVEAATGLGKSAIMGRTTMAAKIGQLTPEGDRKRRALIVTPSRLINDQLAGIVGDDTFRRFAPPGFKVVSYSGDDSKKCPPASDADVVVTTIEQFVSRTKQGRFAGQEFDLLLVDEAHQLTEPQFQQAYLKEWRVHHPNKISEPIPTIGFTARTAYDVDKDVAKLLPVVIRHESLKDYMRKDILSAGQFFTVVVDPEYEVQGSEVKDGDIISGKDPNKLRSEALMQTVRDITAPLLQEGRRGIIFCEAGGKSEQAQDLAKYLDGVPFGEDQKARAEALYVWDPKTLKETKQKIQDFNDGNIDILTTVGVGQQGLNADFNFVVICGNVTSLQKLTQEIGRGMRRSKDFPVTVFIHVVAGYEHRAAATATFGDIFDDDLSQGEVIGPKPVARRQSRIRQDDNAKKAFNVEKLPDRIKILLSRVTTHTSQEIESQLNAGLPIPDEYVSFEKLYVHADKRMDRARAKRRLDAAGYAWRARIETDEQGKRWLHRYYEPSADTYFTKNPLPADATEDMKPAIVAAKYLGISETFLEKLRIRMEEQTPIRRVLRLKKTNHAILHYSRDALEWLETELAKIDPEADDDRSKTALAKELDVNETVVRRTLRKLPNMEPQYKRLKDGKGFGWLYSNEQAKRVAEALNATPMATTEWSFTRIAQEAGVSRNIEGHLTPAEVEATRSLRSSAGGQVRTMDHLPEAMARVIVARIKEKQLGLRAHLMPYAVAVEATHAPKSKISTVVEDAEVYRYNGNRSPTRFIGWEGLRRIIEKYGWRETEYDIDFSRLPRSADDTDGERQIYARAVQLKFMTAEYMGNPDGIID